MKHFLHIWDKMKYHQSVRESQMEMPSKSGALRHFKNSACLLYGGAGGGKHTQIKYLCHKNHLFPELNPNETSVEGPNLALSFLKVTASVTNHLCVCQNLI